MEKACNVVCPETSLQCHLSGPHVRQSYGPIPVKSINKMLMRKLSLEESFWLRTRGSRVRGGIQDQPHTGASLLGMCLHDSRTARMSYTLTHTIHRPYFPSPARTKGCRTTYRHSPPLCVTCCFLQSHFQSLQMPAGCERSEEEVRTRGLMAG